MRKEIYKMLCERLGNIGAPDKPCGVLCRC